MANPLTKPQMARRSSFLQVRAAGTQKTDTAKGGGHYTNRGLSGAVKAQG